VARTAELQLASQSPAHTGSTSLPTHSCLQESRFQEQARLLRARLPALWDPGCGVQLVTENGRSLLAKAGFVASRVEYTKQSGGRHIAVTHVGADLLTRACYMPDTWGLRVSVCDGVGTSKGVDAAAAAEQPAGGAAGGGGGGVLTDVAGPLCFQGDRLAVAQQLPLTEPGDWVIVADTGAYTLSMYSRCAGGRAMLAGLREGFESTPRALVWQGAASHPGARRCLEHVYSMPCDQPNRRSGLATQGNRCCWRMPALQVQQPLLAPSVWLLLGCGCRQDEAAAVAGRGDTAAGAGVLEHVAAPGLPGCPWETCNLRQLLGRRCRNCCNMLRLRSLVPLLRSRYSGLRIGSSLELHPPGTGNMMRGAALRPHWCTGSPFMTPSDSPNARHAPAAWLADSPLMCLCWPTCMAFSNGDSPP
jgi:hypothetical protein